MVRFLIIISYTFISTFLSCQEAKSETDLIIVWEFSYQESIEKENFTILSEKFNSLFKEEYSNIENIVLMDKEKLDSIYSKSKTIIIISERWYQKIGGHCLSYPCIVWAKNYKVSIKRKGIEKGEYLIEVPNRTIFGKTQQEKISTLFKMKKEKHQGISKKIILKSGIGSHRDYLEQLRLDYGEANVVLLVEKNIPDSILKGYTNVLFSSKSKDISVAEFINPITNRIIKSEFIKH